MSNSKRYLVLSFLCCLLVNAVLYWVQNPTLATVDLTTITQTFIQQQAKKKQSDAQKRLAIKAFSHALDQSLIKLSNSKHLILLPKEAVIKGGKDYTALLQSMMARELGA